MGITAALVVIAGLGKVVAPWPGRKSHFTDCARAMPSAVAQQPPSAPCTSSQDCNSLPGSHAISGRRCLGDVLLFSHHRLRLYLEEGNQNSPHFPPHTLQPPYKEESREKLPIYTSGRCSLIALVQREDRHGSAQPSALQTQQRCCF